MTNPSIIAMNEGWENGNGETLVGGADVSIPYFYLCGGMTGIPQFNFPAFDAAAAKTRGWGMNICNPAELENERERAECMANETGENEGDEWENCLQRDLPIVWDKNCVGVICIDGWEHSQGARLETYVANAMGKPLYKLLDFGLLVIDSRRKALEAAGVLDG